MHNTNKNAKSGAKLKLLRLVAVASAVIGAIAILYFGGLSALSLATSTSQYSGSNHKYGYPLNTPMNSTSNQSMPNGTSPYFSNGAMRFGIAGTMWAHSYGLFSGILMVLLGVVTLKYAKLKVKLSA